MSDPSQPPAPRYGEYASPEEVAAALGRPAPPDPEQRLHPEAPPPEPTVPPGPQAGPAPSWRWDRLLTLGLLALGLFHLLTSAPSMLSLDAMLQLYFERVPDAPEVDFGTPTRVIGQVMLVCYALIYAFTAVSAWRRLRTGRLAFWIPLLGAAAAFTMIALATVVILIVDPGFAAALRPPA